MKEFAKAFDVEKQEIVNDLSFANEMQKSRDIKIYPTTNDKFLHKKQRNFFPNHKLNHNQAKQLTNIDFAMHSYEYFNAEDVLSYYNKEIINKQIFNKLKNNEIKFQASLDLHNFSLYDCFEKTNNFIGKALLNGLDCIRIIHGKGFSKENDYLNLKSYVFHWLTKHEKVLALASAKQKFGGNGAVVVLLNNGKY